LQDKQSSLNPKIIGEVYNEKYHRIDSNFYQRKSEPCENCSVEYKIKSNTVLEARQNGRVRFYNFILLKNN